MGRPQDRQAKLIVDAEHMPQAVREACAARNISTIFRFLVDSGMSQRELAVLVKMNQSEIVKF
jgi:hypothetical protein